MSWAVIAILTACALAVLYGLRCVVRRWPNLPINVVCYGFMLVMAALVVWVVYSGWHVR